MNFTLVAILAGISIVTIICVGLLVAKFWAKPTKQYALVITGGSKERVLTSTGGIVWPIINTVAKVSLGTCKLEFLRDKQRSFRTQDNMRVDVGATFFTRVKQDEESIRTAARTLGHAIDPDYCRDIANGIRGIVEDKFEGALRDVCKQMSLDDQIQNREEFMQRVQKSLEDDLAKNGLEIETCSLTLLEQTQIDFYDPQNKYDAEALTTIKRRTEEMRKIRNDVEKDTAVQVAAKDKEATLKILEVQREEEFARLEQQQQVETARAQTAAEISKQTAEREKEAKQAQIIANKEADLTRVTAEQEVQSRTISRDRVLAEERIAKERLVRLAEQDKAIAIAAKSEAESEAMTRAEEARAAAARAAEAVSTATAVEIAERQRRLEVIEAQTEAERIAADVTIRAAAEKTAEIDRAEAIRTKALAEAEAEKIRAAGRAETLRVEAEGKEQMVKAENQLSSEIIAMQLRVELIRGLPKIIAEQVRPMQAIESIRIVDLAGASGFIQGGGQGGAGGGDGDGLSADTVAKAALKYKMASPIIDSLVRQVGGFLEDGKGEAETVEKSIDGMVDEFMAKHKRGNGSTEAL